MGGVLCLKSGDKILIILTPEGMNSFDVAGNPEKKATVSRVFPDGNGKTIVNAFGEFNFPINEIGFCLEGDKNIKEVTLV